MLCPILGPSIEALSFMCICVCEIVLLSHFVFYYENFLILLGVCMCIFPLNLSRGTCRVDQVFLLVSDKHHHTPVHHFALPLTKIDIKRQFKA